MYIIFLPENTEEKRMVPELNNETSFYYLFLEFFDTWSYNREVQDERVFLFFKVTDQVFNDQLNQMSSLLGFEWEFFYFSDLDPSEESYKITFRDFHGEISEEFVVVISCVNPLF